eukprot:TRINITY_DN21554_c0_g1_i1.p1 TRINITY_DN21554_c0_g1~~TRINITY_DN21554_c0_g1_i1.p1  ORF type:complete len:396 (+),score=83.31 TRINITY_DN21554_c0_g1_i1:52-1188(+)
MEEEALCVMEKDAGSRPARPVILDTGSSTLKAGLAGATTPTVTFPSVVGRSPVPTDARVVVGAAGAAAAGLRLQRAVESGSLLDIDSAELLWKEAFSRLGVRPEDRSVLLAVNTGCPRVSRERAIEVLFERFGCPSIRVVSEAPLSAAASGKTTAVVAGVGHGVTDAVVVYEGSVVHHAAASMPVCGSELTDWMQELLQADPAFRQLPRAAQSEAARVAKETLCAVAPAGGGKAADPPASFTLPDGTVMQVGSERRRCPEALFDAGSAGRDTHRYSSLQQLTNCVVLNADKDVRTELRKNVVLAGGSSLFPGMGSRLAEEMQALCPGADVQVTADPGRGHSVFRGGSIAASMPTFADTCVTRDMYDIFGPSYVLRACF